MPWGWLDRHDRGGQRRGDVARMRERPRLINRIRGPELGFKISPPLPRTPLSIPIQIGLYKS